MCASYGQVLWRYNIGWARGTGPSALEHHDEECLDMLQALAAERLSVMTVERVCEILEDLLLSLIHI